MVDFNKKIINSDKFRQSAINFINTGQYCSYPQGTSEFFQFWDREKDRCIDGYTADDGDYISGYNYFYLNYCPIQRIVYKEKIVNGIKKIVKTRELLFPDFYDYDYYFFQAMQQAEEEGKHLCALKSRRKGYSYKNAAMACRNYYLIPNSKTYIYASNKQYLTEDGILTKAWDYMNFIDKNTAWGKKRSVNTQMRKRAGFFTKDDYGNEVELGYKSEIIGVTLKDNPDIVRGKAGKLIIFEEAGSFSELGAAWQIARPSVEQDGVAFGTMVAFGCVCAGSRVWTAEGNCVNIEDITFEDGIMGWDTYQAYPQNISNINPPSEKPCLRITTNSGRSIECSIDHPLLWSTPGKTKRVPGKRNENQHMKSWLWHRADLCKVGDQVGIIDEIPYFGKKKMWEPRLIGWLIGDGTYGYDKTPRIANCDKNIINYILGNFDTAIEKEYTTKEGKEYKEIRIKGICKQLRELGIYGQTKDKKRLPLDIHTYDRYTLTELIGGLFDTDGYIRVEKDGRVRIILTQCQKEILLQVQEVLLHFGIHCSVRHIKSDNREHYSNGRLIKSKNGEWRLEINDITSVSKFADNIELHVDYKQSALDLIYLFAQNHLAKHHKYVSGIHAERIIKIEDIGVQKIYNLTANEQNNYIVNGIVTHNTGGDEGCITENNFVYTSDGRQISIKNLTKSDKLIGYNNKNRTLTEEPVTFINIPTEKQCVKLTTNSGRTIECSTDHPIYSSNNKDYNDCLKFDWHNAGELNIGNYIAISKDIPYFGNNRIDNARAIGIFIGDGSYKDGSSVRLTSCDEEIKNYIKSIYPCSIIKSNYTKQGKELEQLLVKKAKYDINALGINNQTKQSKRLPDIINSCDKQTISELLGGLYDTDGCVSTTYSKKRNTYSTIINLTQSSKQLLEQVLLLLQKFGIRGYIYEVKHKRSKNSIVNSSKNTYYSLDIHDRDSIINFRNNIKFIVKYKQDKLEKAEQYYINRKSLQKNRGFYYEKITKIENVGLKTVYNISAGLSHTYLVNGIITHNSHFETLKDMFYNPEGYNCLEFDNIWDESATTKKCGFFIPQYTNLDFRDKEGHRIYMDDNGNTLHKKSLEFILEERRKVIENATNSNTIDRYVAEHCITPSEACLEFNGNIFPKKELQEQLALLRTNKNLKNYKQVGDLTWEPDGSLRWTIKKSGDITHYPLKKEDNPEGSIVIWEHPNKEASAGLYIAGIDSYDYDESSTTSLGSCIIYKRVQSIEQYSDIIVAEYTGRPKTADEFYENVRKLLIYYNARAMYENQNKGIFVYFTNKHCDYLLADQPDIINDIVSNSKVQRKKGCHMNKQIKQWGWGLIKDWLNDINADGKKNLYNILSEPLLEELIAANDVNNVDRVMALTQVMIYREQLYNVKVKEVKKENKNRVLFEGPIFTQSWFRDDDTDDLKAYMF